MKRVTDILQPWNDFSSISDETLQVAADRGQLVHLCCAALLNGLWMPTIPDSIAGYIESWQIWHNHNVKEVISVEGEFVDKGLGIMGHPDAVILNYQNQIVLPDWKTPELKSKTWPLQIAAYVHLWQKKTGRKVARWGALQLKKDGSTPHWEEYKDYLQYFAVFLSCKTAHDYFKG